MMEEILLGRKPKPFLLIALLFAFIGLFAGCQSEDLAPAITAYRNEVFLNILEGCNVPIEFVGIEQTEIEFALSDENVIKIEDFMISPLEAGHTEVIAKYKKNNTVSATFDVYVQGVDVKAPVIYSPKRVLKTNDSTVLLFKDPASVQAPRECFEWTIDNPSLLTINEDYTVTALSVGETTVTATLKSDPSIFSSYTITITDDAKRLIPYTTDPNATVKAGEYLDLFLPGVSEAEKNLYYFKSAANQIAMVNESHQAIGVKAGIAEIDLYFKATKELIGTIYVTVIGTPNVDYAKRLVDIALAEEGYVEGHNKDTKYGAWYNLNHEDWCAMFVSWCANEAGISTGIIPKYALVSAGKEQFESQGRFRYAGEYIPKTGDIIFFLTGASHTGIVTKVENGRVYTIEGNTSHKVAQRNYPLDYHTITGYGVPDYPEYSK